MNNAIIVSGVIKLCIAEFIKISISTMKPAYTQS